MAVFRIERTRDYTVMSNHHLRNANLSLKAKGLLSMMLSLRNALLSTYANFLEDKITGNDRELTVTETGEIQQRCRELLEKCREP